MISLNRSHNDRRSLCLHCNGYVYPFPGLLLVTSGYFQLLTSWQRYNGTQTLSPASCATATSAFGEGRGV